jgi:hypothetical protein
MVDADIFARQSAAFAKLDPYAASSLLQKAIRRGDANLAERAANRLYQLRGKNIWRRFLIIAFEDVGVGSAGALVKTAAECVDPSYGAEIDPRRCLGAITRMLAEAPKDRSADHLIGAAWSHPGFAEARLVVDGLSHSARLDLVEEAEVSLSVRAIAAWRASGLKWGAMRGKPHHLSDLMATYTRLGVPDDLMLATQEAAARTREPIVIMAPLLWLAARQEGAPSVVACPLPDAPELHGVPLYTFDKHTAIGKGAIHRFARECKGVRDALNFFVPEESAQDVACMAAFYADAAPVSRRLLWPDAEALEALGVEADMMRAGAPSEGVGPIQRVVRDNLGHLNMIRLRLFSA